MAFRIVRAVMRRLPQWRPRPAILTYHRVAETGSDPWGLAVTPERFTEQVGFLARRRTVLGLAEFAGRLAAGTLPRDAVAITFDDGYADNLRNAEPILAAAGLPATLFVVSGMIGRPGPFWWDELAGIILERDEPLDCRVEIGGGAEHLRLPARERADKGGSGWRGWQRPRSARQAAYLGLWNAIRRLSPGRREAAMETLRRVAPPAADGEPGRALTAEELKGLAGRGTFSVGAHTVSHPVLPCLVDGDRRHEIEAGRAELQSLIGRPVPGFSYPYGQVDAPTRDAVARAGFEWACAADPPGGRAGCDLLRLPRLRAPNGGAAALARTMASAPAWDRGENDAVRRQTPGGRSCLRSGGIVSRVPMISIVVPFFEVGDYLAECIESVLAQSFEDWELILVDDGCTDAGCRISRDYAASYPDRVIVLGHPGRANRGISASRNLGAAHARGQWVASLDGDDVWLPDALSDRVRILGAHLEVGLVMGATLYWNSWAGEGSPPDIRVPVGAPQDQVHHPPRLHEMLYPLAQGAAPSMNTVLVRTDILRRVGGWEDTFPTAYEDQALLAKLYLVTPAYVSSACWDRYRQRPGSCMERELRGRRYHTHRRRFFEWFDGYLERQGGPADIRRRVQDALRVSRPGYLHGLARLGRRSIRVISRHGN